MDKSERFGAINQALEAYSGRIERAGREPVLNVPKRKDGEPKSWAKAKVNWKSCTYISREFRENVGQFEKDRNLSRFIYRTAKYLLLKEVTLANVQKMLDAADETIWILGEQHEFDGDGRKATWVMQFDRNLQRKAMFRIEQTGYAKSEMREIEIQKEQRQQRVWTLTK